MDLPFDCIILDKEPVSVTNRLGGGTVLLTPEAVAVYDCIIGAEMIGNYKMVQQGCEWFRRNFPKEYMVLLD
jgi:hypothetical protein